MANYSNLSSNVAPWYSYRNNIKNVVIENGVTSIGNWAFYKCTSLTSITFESPTTEVGDDPLTIPSTATIYGYTGSTAETFAKNNGFNFVSLGDDFYSGFDGDKDPWSVSE